MKPIQLDFKPSNVLSLIISLIGLGAGSILILPVLVWQIKLMLGIVISSGVIYTVCHYGLLLLPWSCVAFKVSSSNQAQLTHRNGKILPVEICRNTVVTPYLTVVNCKVQEASFLARIFAPHLVILPDMLDAEAYRQLRVWLRWGKPSHA